MKKNIIFTSIFLIVGTILLLNFKGVHALNLGYPVDSIIECPNFAVNDQTNSSLGFANSSGANAGKCLYDFNDAITTKFKNVINLSDSDVSYKIIRNNTGITCSASVNCSICGWFNPEQNGTDRYLYEFRNSATGQYYFTTDTISTTGNYDLCNTDTGFNPTNNRYYALCVSLIIGNSTARLWVDGVLNTTVTCNTANGNPNDITIGGTLRADGIGSPARWGKFWFFQGPILNSTMALDFNSTSTAFILSNYNMTSSGGCTVWNANKSAPCTTEDATPTVSFNTNTNALCRIWTNDYNYTGMTEVRNCTSGEGNISHTCTLRDQDALSASGNLFISCRDTGGGGENGSSSSSGLYINLSSNISEAGGDAAIELGINQSVIGSSAIIYSEKRLYVRSANNSQQLAKFDKVATDGNQIWAINHIASGEMTSNFTYLFNITPVLYVYEITNLPSTNITNSVKQFINSTKQ